MEENSYILNRHRQLSPESYTTLLLCPQTCWDLCCCVTWTQPSWDIPVLCSIHLWVPCLFLCFIGQALYDILSGLINKLSSNWNINLWGQNGKHTGNKALEFFHATALYILILCLIFFHEKHMSINQPLDCSITTQLSFQEAFSFLSTRDVGLCLQYPPRPPGRSRAQITEFMIEWEWKMDVRRSNKYKVHECVHLQIYSILDGLLYWYDYRISAKHMTVCTHTQVASHSHTDHIRVFLFLALIHYAAH